MLALVYSAFRGAAFSPLGDREGAGQPYLLGTCAA